MNSHKTATQARPELRISMLPGERCSPGVLPAMRAYIKRAYEGHYKIVWTEDNPHLLFVQAGLSIPPRRAILTTKIPQYGNYLFIFWTDEAVRPLKIADHSFSFYPDTPTNTWFPEWVCLLYDDFVTLLNGKLPQRMLDNRQTSRPNFCAFVHLTSKRALPRTIVRNELCAELMKYKKVLCPGAVMNNVQMPEYMLVKPGAEDRTQGLIRYLSECKFFICFENHTSSRQKPNAMRYVTPKLLAAFIAGSIPIYSGYREIAELFNPAAFINADNFSSRQELIEYIKQVDNSPELTAAYQNAPPILPNSPLHNLHPDKIKPVFLSLAERALEQAQQAPRSRSYSHYMKLYKIDTIYHDYWREFDRFKRRTRRYLERKLKRETHNSRIHWP